MKISDLFRFNTAQSQSNASRVDAQPTSADRQAREANQDGQDTVSISPLARQFQQVSQILADDANEESSRVADIKARIESGQYSVDSREVAASVVRYAQESEL
ncbi:MAG: flagellar biosynthesis anti-sigma factor FlgM [Bdellovibrionales bacterium]|nr:flagellar biosynthesis anti-sigma factor FlgM [Bdellovibrionales bacterium]